MSRSGPADEGTALLSNSLQLLRLTMLQAVEVCDLKTQDVYNLAGIHVADLAEWYRGGKYLCVNSGQDMMCRPALSGNGCLQESLPAENARHSPLLSA